MFSNTIFFMHFISAGKKAISMVFVWGDSDKDYLPIRFEYKTSIKGYLVVMETIS